MAFNPIAALRRVATRLAYSGVTVKNNPVYQSILSMGLKGPVWSLTDYQGFATEGYQQNSDVYACINKICKAAKSVPWRVYSKDKSGDLTEVKDEKHPLVALIRRPNPRQSWGRLMEQLFGFEYVAGNSYLLRVGPPRKNAPPKELYVIRPDRTMIRRGNPMEPIAGYQYTAGNVVTPLDPDRTINGVLMQTVLHWFKFHPTDDWYGLSPIQAAARSVDQNNAAQAHNLALIQNGATPSGALVFDQILPRPDYLKLKEEVELKWQGTQNAGLPIVLAGAKWQQLGLSPVDMDWLEAQRLSTRRICTIFGVPSELIGDPQNKTYSNQKEARKSLYMDTVLPDLDEIAGELNNWLVPLFNDESLIISYDVNAIDAIQEDRESIWSRGTLAAKGGLITPNEFRAMVGLDDHLDPIADMLLIPTHQLPMGDPEAPAGNTNPNAADVEEGAEGSVTPSTRKPKPKPKIPAVPPGGAMKPGQPGAPAGRLNPKPKPKPAKKWRELFFQD